MTEIDDNQPKSKNQEKNEAKRKAKMEKFLAKQAKLGSQPEKPANPEKKKVEKKVQEKETFINTTPKGEKKDLSMEMASSYDPMAVESAWYDWWKAQGYFEPAFYNGEPSPKGVYMIPIPPPNVTGYLHIGHALTCAIQDAMIRWNRMQGKTVLFNPGCDHAGIATQSVVEKNLWKDEKLTRHDLGREKFIERVWEWKEMYGNRIYNQCERLGGSYDWKRARFTMDPMLATAVNEAFVLMHEEGLIYRQNRLINWCPKLNTALSNLEVENKALTGRTWIFVPSHDPNTKYEFGILETFCYEIENSDEKIQIATTRLETMLGDTAIAVHPKDSRYKHLHGKFAVHPFVNRKLRIIADEMVDMEFGTGAVKITPAHDANDFEAGKRYGLEFINIMNDNGSLNQTCGQFEGMLRFDARKAVRKALQEKNLYIKSEDNAMALPICTRSGDVIEPMMKPQWWMNCKDMAQKAMKAVTDGDLDIQPKSSEKEWFKWLSDPQDWCISRQLWWGHRIPAYKLIFQDSANEEEVWVSGRTEEEAMNKAKKKFPSSKFTLHQDEDVLDTWFSSGIWPFSILGWPEKTKDLEVFYPNSLLETGWDILFFWVARMVMMGLHLMKEVPFKKVFCHAMVRDAHGRKMSKSLGNVIDPIDVIEGISLSNLQERLLHTNLDPREIKKAQEGQKQDYPNGIPQCGVDALRFALCAYTSTGRDLNLNILRVEGYRKFCNKIWNACRFGMINLGADFVPEESETSIAAISLVEKWILCKLNRASAEANSYLEQMNFMACTTSIHNFWLYEFCDVFLEAIKPLMDEGSEVKKSAQSTLYSCLENGLKLLHPFMPFITEELWQRLPRRKNDSTSSIVISSYPEEKVEWRNETVEQQFGEILSIVRAARSLMADYNMKSNAKIYIFTNDKDLETLFKNETSTIQTLIKGATDINVITNEKDLPSGCASSTISSKCNVSLLAKGFVDFEAEISKLTTKIEKIHLNMDQLQKKMDVPDYREKVKEEVRESNSQKMESMLFEVDTMTKCIENFKKMATS